MRVLLTGGTGKVGRATVKELVEAGHTVTVVGRSEGCDVEDATYLQCDVNDYDRLFQIMSGHDAVVHLAAVPTPLGKPGRELFRVNNLGTFNVFESAAACGIRRVVGASSINALGYFFGDRGIPIRYLPIDEDHETLATDAYSFSKQIMEATARYFWERDRISSVLLRLPAVISHDRTRDYRKGHGGGTPPIAARLLAMPDAEREAETRRLAEAYEKHRSTHRLEYAPIDWRKVTAQFDPEVITEEELRYMSYQVNFFAYIDELDSAQAIRKALEADYDGSHALFVNACRNSTGLSVEEAAKLFWPPVTEIRPHPTDENTLVSIARARKLLGFEPVHMT
jgi:nucleoside-diphosphate-sugar epimerase